MLLLVPMMPTMPRYLGAVARPSICVALHCRRAVEVQKVLAPLGWITVPRNKILDDHEVSKLSTPSSPLTNPSQGPPEVHRQPLASPRQNEWVPYAIGSTPTSSKLLRNISKKHSAVKVGLLSPETQSPEAILRKINPLVI